MASLQDDVIEIGDIIYHPRIDSINVGFLIEEITVCKLIGKSKHPSGTFKTIWNFGDTSFLKNYENERQRKYKNVMKNKCYRTIEECIEWLELQRVYFIEAQKSKKEEALSEVVELKKWIEIARKESLEISRTSNKKIAMLNQFDVKRDLEKRGLI